MFYVVNVVLVLLLMLLLLLLLFLLLLLLLPLYIYFSYCCRFILVSVHAIVVATDAIFYYFSGFRGFSGLPGKAGPLQKLKCGFYKSHSNIKYSSFVRCPFLGHMILSCSCWSPSMNCSSQSSIKGNLCRCVCTRARPTAVCCRVATLA